MGLSDMNLSRLMNMDTGIDIGIDLGTANTLIYVKGKGIVANEPSIVASERSSGKILAIGDEALVIHEKIHPGIITIRPLANGVIADYEATVKLIKGLIGNMKNRFLFGIHRMLISIPLGTTEVEIRAVYDAAHHIGAKEVYLVYEPIAAAIGIGIDPFEAQGNMVINIGCGTTDIAVISLGGIASGESLRVAGGEINSRILRFFREEHNMAISDRAAEEIKLRIASVHSLEQEISMTVRGVNFESGLPVTAELDSITLRDVISTPINQIVMAIKKTVEALIVKPELAIDILDHGVWLTGGGVLLKGLDQKITEETKLKVQICDDPLLVVAHGVGRILEDLETYDSIISSSKNHRKRTSKSPDYSAQNPDNQQ